MEQMILIFNEYGDMLCVALSLMTVFITGITLHKLKKLETGLYKSAEKAETVVLEKPAEEKTKAETIDHTSLAAEASVREQEKLLDAVLGEVFP